MNVGAGTGITVNADSIAISSAYLGANPTGTIGITAVNGSATTYMRSDAAPAFDMTIARPWTAGVHTFTAQSVHNAGMSLGMSGRINSAVVDGGGAIGVLIQPTTTYTVSNPPDRYIAQIKDAAGIFLWSVAADGSLGAQIASHAGTALMEVGAATTALPTTAMTQGLKFAPKWGATAGSSFTLGAGTIGTNVVAAAIFDATDNVSSTATTMIGGAFSNNGLSGRAHSSVVGLATTAYSGTLASATAAHGNLYGVWIRKPGGAAGTSHTATTAYGIYVEQPVGLKPATTNVYGMFMDEAKTTTVASTIVNGIFLASATAGYKALVLGSQSNWLAWETSTSFSLNATTVLCKADFDVSAKNITGSTTTGTKIMANAAHLLGFWNAAPIAQPTAAIPAAAFVTNTSLIANDTATFDGYTIGQVVKALRNSGLLA